MITKFLGIRPFEGASCSRLLLGSGLFVLASSLATNATAQASGQDVGQPSSDEEVRLEEIVITGTRVRGMSGPVGSSVLGISREDVEASSQVSVTDMLREVPQVANLGITDVTRDTPGGNNNINYGNAINLRGLGPFSTLSLVNGRRVPINFRNFEPSAIPMLALDRVEVVPDGASAVYGSDAVAGVVNMVMRRDVDGGQVMARYGSADGYSEHRFGASWGTTWDSGQFFIAGELSEQSNLNGDDRDYYGQGQTTTQCDPGTIVIDDTSYAIPEGGVTAADANTLTPGTENTCRSLAGQDIRPESERDKLAFTFNQEITDRIEFALEGFYSERNTTRLTGWSNQSLQVPSSNAFFVDPTGSATTSTVHYELRDYPNSGKDTPLGSRYWQLTPSLTFELGNDWQAEAMVGYGEAPFWSRETNNIDSGALSAALASSDPDTAFDPYGLHRTNQDVLDNIRSAVFDVDSKSEFTSASLSADGPLFDLPGGTVQFAGGYERQEYDNTPWSRRGPASATFGCRPCQVAGEEPPLERDVNSVFGELIVPLVGSDNASDMIQRLDVRAALRYDDYSDVGNTTNPQVGITWEPNDTMTVRGSWGTSFRAPILPSIYGNSSAFFIENFPDASQPGDPDIVGAFRSGGNPNLEPEEATTWTLGVDWQPIEGAEISLTYFDVEYENQIQSYLGDNNILFREDIFAGTGIIMRGQDAEDFVNQDQAQNNTPIFGSDPDPFELVVDGRPQNLGVTLMSGVDLTFSYSWDNDSGAYRLNVNGTYVRNYEEAQTPQAPLVDETNTIYNPKTLRGRGSLSWSRGAYSARLGLNFVNGYDNTLTTPEEDVDAHVTADLSGSIRLGDEGGASLMDGWLVSLDIRNLFDSEPPEVNVDPYGFDPTAHDPMGRLISMSVRKNF